MLNAVSRVWLECIERYTRVAVFDENTRFSGHGMLFSWIPQRLSCPWYCCCLVDSVFGTIQRRLACPCASVDTHQSRSVVKFHVAQFQRCGASFSLFPLNGGYLCILVVSYGHFSLITDQLDWQRHCCGVVVGSLVSCDS